MKRLYRLVLDCNAISVFFVIYLIKEHEPVAFCCIDISYLIYLVGIILFTGVCLMLSRFLPDETMSEEIKEVELADGSYLPSFLGYFFVALSVKDVKTLMAVALIIFVFTYYSQTLYFNPMFLIFGYKFYYITMNNGLRIFILSKKTIRRIDKLQFDYLKRINDYTFIDRSKEK